MLRLLSLLQSGRQWPAAELADANGCTSRTLRRDIEYLRELGYPVRSVRGPGGHYQLVAGRALPPLMLEDDEATATVLGLQLAASEDAAGSPMAEAARRAGDKLRRILPPALRRSTDQLLAAIELTATAYPLPLPELLRAIAASISVNRTLVFCYRGKGGDTEREVEPARMLRLRHRWYLFGWDRERGDWRTFRLDRIDGIPVTGSLFRSRTPPADDLTAYLREHFHGVPTLAVTLTLHASAADAATRLHRIDGVIETLGENRCRYTAHVDSYEWLTLVLILTDIDFTVEAPDSFGEYLAARAQRLLRAV
jgi:predicted DNA-binding transcriptional regulator YafY